MSSVPVQALETDITVSGQTKRILALDLLRGYFLLVILINHIELYPSGLDFLTGKGRLFISAAEGFFFMSGLLIGMVYRRRLHLGMKFIFGKMWQRAAQLYAGSVFLTLLFAVWAVAVNHPAIKYGLPDPVNWANIVKETLLMRFGFGWADFLMRFAILMVFAQFVFYLVAKKKWWLALAAIIVAWAYRGQNFTLGWQILFNGGILIGFYWQQILDWFKSLKPRLRNFIGWSVVAITAISFTYSYGSVYLQSYLNHTLDRWPAWLQNFTLGWNDFNGWIWHWAEKWTIGPLRVLLFFCWFTVLFVIVNRYAASINRRTRGVFELLGRNSLYVYIAEAFIVFIFKFFIPPATKIWQNFLISAFSVVVLVAVTVAYRLLSDHPLPTNRGEFKQLLVRGKALLSGST